MQWRSQHSKNNHCTRPEVSACGSSWNLTLYFAIKNSKAALSLSLGSSNESELLLFGLLCIKVVVLHNETSHSKVLNNKRDTTVMQSPIMQLHSAASHSSLAVRGGI
jgi:hypothetical protein